MAEDSRKEQLPNLAASCWPCSVVMTLWSWRSHLFPTSTMGTESVSFTRRICSRRSGRSLNLFHESVSVRASDGEPCSTLGNSVGQQYVRGDGDDRVHQHEALSVFHVQVTHAARGWQGSPTPSYIPKIAFKEFGECVRGKLLRARRVEDFEHHLLAVDFHLLPVVCVVMVGWLGD